MGGIFKNPLLVIHPQRTHMPNFSSLRAVVSAVCCLSVSHSAMEEFYIHICILIDLNYKKKKCIKEYQRQCLLTNTLDGKECVATHSLPFRPIRTKPVQTWCRDPDDLENLKERAGFLVSRSLKLTGVIWWFSTCPKKNTHKLLTCYTCKQ